ncbi:hypothetical protein [Desulfurobacterium crinifex]
MKRGKINIDVYLDFDNIWGGLLRESEKQFEDKSHRLTSIEHFKNS